MFARTKVLSLVLLAILGIRGATGLASTYRLSINETESLPNWAFWINQRERTPKRGQIAAFVPPPNPYYPRGTIFCKVVYGVPGDLVTRVGRDYFVAGKFVGHAKEASQTGRLAALGPTGILPPGHYFVGTGHKDGYDSRYADIGWVPQSHIVGTAAPVL